MRHTTLPRREEYPLRGIALFEAFKGCIGLAVMLGLLSLRHQDLDFVVDRVVDLLHLNREGRLSDFVGHLANRVNERNLTLLIILAIVYSAVRFAEAYGLWFARAWAEWFALISGAIYVPFELAEMARHPHLLTGAVLIINVLIVLYMAKLRVEAHRTDRSATVG